MDPIEVECNSALKYKFKTVGLDSFYHYLGPMYPKMTDFDRPQRSLACSGQYISVSKRSP